MSGCVADTDFLQHWRAAGLPRARRFRIGSNSTPLAERQVALDRFDAGTAPDTINREAMTGEFPQRVVDTASGRPARNEISERREMTIWKDV